MKNRKDPLIRISLAIVMASLVAVATYIVRIPNPWGGYFNVGDVLIFVAALTFDPFIGCFSAGLGSAVADMIGFPLFVIPTFIIKGLEGLIAAAIADKKSVQRDILAVVLAGSEMVAGYFLVEYVVLQWGLAAAAGEVVPNIAQILIGGVVGIPLATVLRKRLPEIIPQTPEQKPKDS